MAVSNPNIVILPFPAQGHIKPMLMLADLLTGAGLPVTFVNTEHNHRHIADHRRRRPAVEFLTIPDGLPPDHPRSGIFLIDLFSSIVAAGGPALKTLVASMRPAPACIISDGMMSFAVDVAAEVGVPAVAFRTYSASCTWTTLHLRRLVEDGEIPISLGI
ncbi:UDP-glycosyltransferase 1 [Striga asiatica]|uniref:UDP-glycosyltransferase 1 n=1 Tax=Striga asiatica TaxID=4170 RepID=A0A5A7RAT3_STRAF|nr:UDP-glycosyltransferase 1 [Striga asiatica]